MADWMDGWIWKDDDPGWMDLDGCGWVGGWAEGGGVDRPIGW